MAESRRVCSAIRGKVDDSPLDATIAALAARQHGVISRWQLLGLGLSRHAIDRRIAAGRLHPVHRGVYAVGHPRISREGQWFAAVLACAPDAALSHRSAANLWGIRAHGGRIELTVPRPRRKSPLFIARRSALQPDEITEHRNIPTTTVARTILDLAAVIPHEHQLDKAIRQADYLTLLDMTELEALMHRHPRRKGVQRLRQAVATASAGMTTTRSDLEDRFRALLLRANLPRPVLNATIELGEQKIEVDALWPDHKLIIELDGRETHHTKTAFEQDRLRDRKLAANGYTVIRITWRQLEDDRAQVLADIRAALSACTRRRSGRPRAGARRG
ncbi:MAG: type IV toxin-antitoxin system AbiEi family antitoxin domain-containing protein [Thermoleophilaceae bacterium]